MQVTNIFREVDARRPGFNEIELNTLRPRNNQSTAAVALLSCRYVHPGAAVEGDEDPGPRAFGQRVVSRLREVSFSVPRLFVPSKYEGISSSRAPDTTGSSP